MLKEKVTVGRLKELYEEVCSNYDTIRDTLVNTSKVAKKTYDEEAHKLCQIILSK